MILYDPQTREEWLERRRGGIGGSDASCVIGKNDYKTNVDLWREKTGLVEPEDISEKWAIKFGVRVEPIMRDLFRAEHEEYDVEHYPYRMHAQEDTPFIYATLDGDITDKDTGEHGILEIKTCTIQNSMMWDEWDNRIPDRYYAQMLHQLFSTGWNFAWMFAYLRYTTNGERRAQVREYRIDREDVEEDIEYLIDAERKFWERVQKEEEPPLILPEI